MKALLLLLLLLHLVAVFGNLQETDVTTPFSPESGDLEEKDNAGDVLEQDEVLDLLDEEGMEARELRCQFNGERCLYDSHCCGGGECVRYTRGGRYGICRGGAGVNSYYYNPYYYNPYYNNNNYGIYNDVRCTHNYHCPRGFYCNWGGYSSFGLCTRYYGGGGGSPNIFNNGGGGSFCWNTAECGGGNWHCRSNQCVWLP
jgi:hypothetical protein